MGREAGQRVGAAPGLAAQPQHPRRGRRRRLPFFLFLLLPDRPPLPLPPRFLSRDLPPRSLIGRAAASQSAAVAGGRGEEERGARRGRAGGRSHLHSGARP